MQLKVINCRQWRSGECVAGLYGGRPSAGVCNQCDRREAVGNGPAVTDKSLTIADIAHGAAGLLKAAVGADKASDETIAARRETCRTCEHNRGGAVATCELCGCLLRAKIRLNGESCPAGKW